MRLQAKAIKTVSQLMSLNVLMWLTMLTLFACMLCFAAAAYIAMTAVLVPALAALFTGLGLLCACILLVVAIWLGLHSAGQSTHRHLEQSTDSAPASDTGDWTHDNADILIAGAVTAGIALAASPGLRRFLIRTAGPLVTRKVIHAVKKNLTD